ncbi:MAG: acetylornithine/succinylornithine family transaminase [Chitinivibrionales bacterium]|nr:acetylornithine/succinylornithine family transaminase [Chitinivibrionales bacterium]MBD3356208.1 acetylornithine/succinylornithine family transaminase [Chitinivibrionales bacterium]
MAITEDPNKLFVPTYARSGAPMVKGKGTLLSDANGREYLDFGSGIAVTALGHSHPAIVEALREQGSSLVHASNLYHMEPQIEFARLLIDNSFGSKVFLCNSGTEANEAAIKFARKWATKKNGEKYNILSFTDAFHGRTYGALSATPQKNFYRGFEPMVPGFYAAPFNDLEAAQKVLDEREWAAIFVEPLQGEGGINEATAAFLKFLRDYAAKHSIALVFDEIQCGVGRTGALWCYEHFDVVPDMMTLAKPVGGGLPLGAVVCTDEIASCIAPGDHGTTFGGNPLACALGVIVLSTVAEKSFLDDVITKGKYLKQKLERCCETEPRVEAVPGMGLMLGVRMKEDPAKLIQACRDKGLLVIKAGHNTIRFMPPLTVENEEIDRAVEIFASVLAETGAG